jgi:hypothetical protein
MKRRWPTNPTQWNTQTHGAQTDLHALSGLHHNLETPALKARDYLETLARDTQPKALTSYRHTVQVERPAVNEHSRTGYAQFLVAYNKKRRNLDELAALSEQYSHTKESIVGIDGLCNSLTQQQAVVCWDSCIQPGWQILLQELAGYRPKTTPREATPDDLTQKGADTWRPCEYCTAPTTPEEQEPAVQCHICQRMYHERCLVAAEGTGPTGAEYKCKECTDKGYHQLNLPADLKLLYVEWQPHGEALDTVRASGTPASQAQLETKLREQEERADERPPKRRPVEVSRQTIMPDDTERVYDITIGQLIRQKLVIHTHPINPQADTAPTGACCAYVRNVLHGNPERGQDVCCIYGVDGRCEHMLRPEVAERLRLGYKHIQDKFPETMERLQAGTFEEELRRVCIRYKQDGNTTAEKARYWSIPEELKHALMSGIKAVSALLQPANSTHVRRWVLDGPRARPGVRRKI